MYGFPEEYHWNDEVDCEMKACWEGCKGNEGLTSATEENPCCELEVVADVVEFDGRE